MPEEKASKYMPLWEYVKEHGAGTLTFAQIGDILGFAIDHSFLRYKRECERYGYIVGKISLKAQNVTFIEKA